MCSVKENCTQIFPISNASCKFKVRVSNMAISYLFAYTKKISCYKLLVYVPYSLQIKTKTINESFRSVCDGRTKTSVLNSALKYWFVRHTLVLSSTNQDEPKLQFSYWHMNTQQTIITSLFLTETLGSSCIFTAKSKS